MSKISSLVVRLASPGMPPMWAHEPKATIILLFWRSSLAMCSFSLLRTAPLKSDQVEFAIAPSPRRPLYLPSTAIGQKRMSADRGHVEDELVGVQQRTTSQPPQAAPQYRAICSFLSVTSHLSAGRSASAALTGLGPSARTRSVMSSTMSAKRWPSLALTHSSRTRSSSMPYAASSFLSSG